MKINTSNQKIIIDVDTGVDDSLAIILLIKKISKRIIGITTTGGNIELKNVVNNTLGILTLLDSNIRVYQGSNKNIDNEKFTYAKKYHGENGLCNIKLPTNRKVEKVSAVEFIVQSLEKYENKITIICIGPMTNLAKAINKKPKIADKLDKVIIMGGAVNVAGNETEYAEFNFSQDPTAVKIVFDKIKNIYLVPLDATGNCIIKSDDIDKISNSDKTGKFVIKLIKNWYETFGLANNRFFELYDPLTVATILGDFVEFKKDKINIETLGRVRGKITSGIGREMFYAYKTNDKKILIYFYDILNK
jgi:inosine-uridine nucleoside N-ribohydrolase